MTPGMYWPQHIARLRDTTLLDDEDEHDAAGGGFEKLMKIAMYCYIYAGEYKS